MKKADISAYKRYEDKIGSDIPGAVYALSVIEGIQSGDVFEDGRDWLIWHIGGFAFVSENCRTTTLDFIYDLMIDRDNRRLVLFSDDMGVREYFAEKHDISAEKRYFFEYKGSPVRKCTVPDGFMIEEINSVNIRNINGMVVPSFYWGNEGFMSSGKGFCVTHEDEVVSWAFSAALSSRELDIGVETDERFRGLGLAAAAASELAEHTLSQGIQPTWACHSENTASCRTAEKIGFVKKCECTIFKKIQPLPHQ